MSVTRRWPLPPDHSAPALARALVAEALTDRTNVDDAVLVTSELVTNAVQYGTGPIELALALEDGSVRITVTNEGADGVPAVRAARDDEVGGRGLAITEALAAEWGWDHHADRMSVWAEFAGQRTLREFPAADQPTAEPGRTS